MGLLLPDAAAVSRCVNQRITNTSARRKIKNKGGLTIPSKWIYEIVKHVYRFLEGNADVICNIKHQPVATMVNLMLPNIEKQEAPCDQHVEAVAELALQSSSIIMLRWFVEQKYPTRY